MTDPESKDGLSEIQKFVTIVAMLATVIVILLGGTWGAARSLSEREASDEDLCKAIIQLDANLRFYEAATAADKELTPPAPVDLQC